MGGMGNDAWMRGWVYLGVGELGHDGEWKVGGHFGAGESGGTNPVVWGYGCGEKFRGDKGGLGTADW